MIYGMLKYEQIDSARGVDIEVDAPNIAATPSWELIALQTGDKKQSYWKFILYICMYDWQNLFLLNFI